MKYRIINHNCGGRAYSRFITMGLLKDKIIEIISKQPYRPVVIKVDKSEYTLGRGMFNKLILEEVEDGKKKTIPKSRKKQTTPR